MERDSYEHGVPSWVDLGTADAAKTAEFYSSLFGWTVQQGPPEAGGYSIAELRGRPVAGLGPQQNPGPPYWSTYVNVDDADKAVGNATEAGGTVIVAPMDVMDAGRMAFFSDPQGAVIGVWQPNAHRGAGIVNEPGTLTWNELVTTDVEAAKTFYEKVFGWGAVTHGEGPGAYTEFQVAGRSIAGMMQRPAEMPPRPALLGRLFRRRGRRRDRRSGWVSSAERSIMPPRDIEPGRFAVVADPAGAMFSVMTPKTRT